MRMDRSNKLIDRRAGIPSKEAHAVDFRRDLTRDFHREAARFDDVSRDTSAV